MCPQYAKVTHQHLQKIIEAFETLDTVLTESQTTTIPTPAAQTADTTSSSSSSTVIPTTSPPVTTQTPTPSRFCDLIPTISPPNIPPSTLDPKIASNVAKRVAQLLATAQIPSFKLPHTTDTGKQTTFVTPDQDTFSITQTNLTHPKDIAQSASQARHRTDTVASMNISPRQIPIPPALQELLDNRDKIARKIKDQYEFLENNYPYIPASKTNPQKRKQVYSDWFHTHGGEYT